MSKTLTRRSFLGLATSGVAGIALGGAGLGYDAVSARAGVGGSTSCPSVSGLMPKRQFRAAWIATVENIDWPSEPGLPADRQMREFVRLMEEAAAMNMNAVVVQVRAAADAFYPSRYAPWSEYLTGVPGKNPGYDPLMFMVREAHRRNLELHVWFNPYRVSLQDDRRRLASDSPARRQPEWVVEYGGQLYFDPGIPGVRRLIEGSVLEVVENYNIDAVHFDDYFYPYPIPDEPFPDGATYHKYGAARFDNRGDWRRDNVNRLIGKLSVEIKRAKPSVKFGVSPFAVWRNKVTDPTGSETTAGVQTYDDLYADTRTWIENEWIDYVAPQIYWNIGSEQAAYDVLVPWWSREVEDTGVHLYVGQAAYKIANDNAAWDESDELPSHLRFNQRYPEVKGDIYFSMKDLLSNPLGFKDRLEDDLYKHEALVPVMPSLGNGPPHHPALLSATQTTRGIELEWHDVPLDKNSVYYAVYRFGGGASEACGFEDPRHILATIRRVGDGNTQSFLDTTPRPGCEYTYYVTALNRLHRESKPSNGRSVTVR